MAEKCNTGDLLVTDLKDWELEKETTFAFGNFKTISGNFFANYRDSSVNTVSINMVLNLTRFFSLNINTVSWI